MYGADSTPYLIHTPSLFPMPRLFPVVLICRGRFVGTLALLMHLLGALPPSLLLDVTGKSQFMDPTVTQLCATLYLYSDLFNIMKEKLSKTLTTHWMMMKRSLCVLYVIPLVYH